MSKAKKSKNKDKENQKKEKIIEKANLVEKENNYPEKSEKGKPEKIKETTKQEKSKVNDKLKKQNAKDNKRKNKEKKHGVRIAIEIVVSVAILATIQYTTIRPLISNWKEIDSMAGNSWLQDLANSSLDSAIEPTENSSEVQPTTENSLFENISVSNDDVYSGDLILINSENAYQDKKQEDIFTIYEKKTESYHVSSSDISLRSSAIEALNSMFDDFAETTGHEDIIVISGYRTNEEQQALYDEDLEATGEDTSTLVAKPGYSEHEGGYAVDLSLFVDGVLGDYDGTGDYEWINENCAHYGLILRYPEDKTDITKINFEPWHYRYVGQPHAFYIYQQKLVLEEYIELLKQHDVNNMLEIVNWDGKVYKTYYIPANKDEKTTYVLVPPDTEYTISGNNKDGFIITIDTKETKSVDESIEGSSEESSHKKDESSNESNSDNDNIENSDESSDESTSDIE